MHKFYNYPVVLEAEKAGKSQMFDGKITSKYMELSTNENIITKERCKNWPEIELNFVPHPR